MEFSVILKKSSESAEWKSLLQQSLLLMRSVSEGNMFSLQQLTSSMPQLRFAFPNVTELSTSKLPQKCVAHVKLN